MKMRKNLLRGMRDHLVFQEKRESDEESLRHGRCGGDGVEGGGSVFRDRKRASS